MKKESKKEAEKVVEAETEKKSSLNEGG